MLQRASVIFQKAGLPTLRIHLGNFFYFKSLLSGETYFMKRDCFSRFCASSGSQLHRSKGFKQVGGGPDEKHAKIHLTWSIHKFSL
jgi:hypothetical protein